MVEVGVEKRSIDRMYGNVRRGEVEIRETFRRGRTIPSSFRRLQDVQLIYLA